MALEIIDEILDEVEKELKTLRILKSGIATYYYKGNILHRIYGPAMEFNSGERRWYQNNRLHREDGPAVECPNGKKEWWCEGSLIKIEKS